MHLVRGLYFASYTSPREALWLIGVFLLILMIATAFIGYVLPWGQMSFWGATVITSLASAIPIIGDSVVSWLWGGAESVAKLKSFAGVVARRVSDTERPFVLDQWVGDTEVKDVKDVKVDKTAGR